MTSPYPPGGQHWQDMQGSRPYRRHTLIFKTNRLKWWGLVILAHEPRNPNFTFCVCLVQYPNSWCSLNQWTGSQIAERCWGLPVWLTCLTQPYSHLRLFYCPYKNSFAPQYEVIACLCLKMQENKHYVSLWEITRQTLFCAGILLTGWLICFGLWS